MVRRSYHKDALIVPVGPPAHFFDPPDRAAARARLGVADDVFLVVGSGILVEHRRFEDLIEAMSLLADDPSIHALIAGSDHVDPAYADRLAALIAARELAARVTLPRRSLSDAELKDTYAAADVFVILSQRYAWGLAPLEAIASGTPVILTPGAGVYRHSRRPPRRTGGPGAGPEGDGGRDPALAIGRRPGGTRLDARMAARAVRARRLRRADGTDLRGRARRGRAQALRLALTPVHRCCVPQYG